MSRSTKGWSRDFFYPRHTLDNISQSPLQLGDLRLHLASGMQAKVMTTLSPLPSCALSFLFACYCWILTLRETLEALH